MAKKKPLTPLLDMRFDKTNPAAVQWAQDHAAELVTQIAQTTQDKIRSAVEKAFTTEGEVGSLASDILESVGDETRAQLIARTEVMTAANEGQRQSWDQAIDQGFLTGDEKKEWIATEGACPECQDLDGQVVGINESYPDPGQDGPPLHPNCRCTEGIAAG